MNTSTMIIFCIVGIILGVASVFELSNTPGLQALSSVTAGAFIGVCLTVLMRLILEGRS